ncbi:MAG: penicillin-binding protein activator LpoB [Candidatus Cloacimonetes bacterium]|nr:penicillin-binding protein activator LpoB [Candidatus Cloacimonadota bacterium]
MKKLFIILSLVLLLALTACGPNRNVQRVSTDQTTDLSGRWNDTDSRLVAEEMVRDLLTRPFVGNFTSKNGRPPYVIVGTVKNLSSEHIATDVFVKDIERELLNSGTVRFVASRSDRDDIRDERLDQQSQATEESAKRLAAEVGADYMLQGSIKTIIDRVEGVQAKFYQVDMQLINIENNLTEWMGNKSIKKVVSQRGYKL